MITGMLEQMRDRRATSAFRRTARAAGGELPMSEARLVGVEDRLRHIDETVIRIDERLATILLHFAIKAELTSGLSDVRTEIAELRVAIADKPPRLYR
jgi:hypothetical protein